MIKLLMLGSA